MGRISIIVKNNTHVERKKSKDRDKIRRSGLVKKEENVKLLITHLIISILTIYIWLTG